MPVSGNRPEYNRRDYRRQAAKVAKGHKCVFCGKPADTAHHRTDVAKGGTLSSGLVPACRSCNSRMGGKMSPMGRKKAAVKEALHRTARKVGK
jgi:5-methylcytosine-specific restriction endonuclease McrA